MSFTRINDDSLRIQKQLEEMTFQGRYQLDTPGQGINLPFSEDPQIRLQQWGANLRTNPVQIENELLGLARPIGRDYLGKNEYTQYSVQSTLPAYPSAQPFVDETRATHPAWVYRDMEHPRWEFPWINPQANVEKRFHDNIQTRIMEKDYYVPRLSVPSMNDKANPTTVQYYLH